MKLFIILFFFISILNIFSQGNSGYEDSVYIVTSESGLILRDGPGINFKKITIIPYDEKVIVYEFTYNTKPSTPESLQSYKFTGKKTYYHNNKITANYKDRPWDDTKTCLKISGHYGYWLKCNYKNFKGWAFSGFLVKEKVMDKIDNADVLKTIPYLWIPVDGNFVHISGYVGINFIEFYPDGLGLYSDDYPCFIYGSVPEAYTYLIKGIEIINDQTISIHVEVKEFDHNENIILTKNNSDNFQFWENYINIESAYKLPVNIYLDEGHDDSPQEED